MFVQVVILPVLTSFTPPAAGAAVDDPPDSPPQAEAASVIASAVVPIAAARGMVDQRATQASSLWYKPNFLHAQFRGTLQQAVFGLNFRVGSPYRTTDPSKTTVV
jgi:hypothetical protein